MKQKYAVNLPKTDFPMKADLPNREPKILEKWEQLDIYQKLCNKNNGKEKFMLHDGPPYANGAIHLGHALNKILKDIIVKYKSMQGYDAPYVPGWDCHGLPIEYQLLKDLKVDKSNIDQVDFRKKAAEYAQKFIDLQRNEFKRLGVFGDWENPYITMSPGYEEKIIRSFKELVKKGYIYRRKKPVYWCIYCETALAEAEIEYKDHNSPSVYVKFPVVGGINPPESPFVKGGKEGELSAVIWTTTPWTLPANLALAFHPEYEYIIGKFQIPNHKLQKEEWINLVIAKGRLEAVVSELGIKKHEILTTIKGSELKGIKFRHPLLDKESVGVNADFVSLEDGTGIVHIAPGHGEEDYEVGLANELSIFSPVDNQGKFTDEVKQFSGQRVFKANPEIVTELINRNLLLGSGEISHQYPHCWRCKQPIIFRATEQWFLNVNHQNLRQKLLEAVKEVKWIPQYGINRISGMIESRPDWCLSRQRYWGTPLPVIYCDKCNNPLLEESIIERIEKMFGEYGSDCWYIESANKFVPEGFKCSCGSTDFRKEKDILDVWFDSGVSHESVLKIRDGLKYPADVYLEGSDQHRGWFQTSLIPAVALDGNAPYKLVLTHGFVLDGQGRAMHKSLGNVIAPQEVIKKYGAEIIRLWVASSDYREDVRISPEILNQLSEMYRKIRNTLRFLLGNISDYLPLENKVEYQKLWEIDRFMLHRLQEIVGEVTESYNRFEFNRVLRTIHDFCVSDLSTFYLDILKDRLYTFKADSIDRRAAQTVLSETLVTLLPMLSPLLAFTAEESWGYLKAESGERRAESRDKESVFLLDFPKVKKEYISENLAKDWERIVEIKKDVNCKLEENRANKIIGSSLAAKVVVEPVTEEEKKFFEKYDKDHWRMVFLISDWEVKEPTRNSDNLKNEYIVSKAEGNKCIRCWNYVESVGKNIEHPELCERCVKNI